MLLNLDVIQTLKNPLDRSSKLVTLRKVMHFGIMIIILICLSCIPFLFRKIEEIGANLPRDASAYTEQNLVFLLDGSSTIDL